MSVSVHGVKFALSLSVLGHVALGVWVSGREIPPAPPRPAPLLWIDSAPAPEEVEPPPVTVAPPKASPAKQRPRPPPGSPATSPSAAVAPLDSPLISDVPVREQPIDVLPPTANSSFPVGPPDATRGRTLHPDDPTPSKEALAAEERARVKGRVEALAGDELATARAERGLPHPYFTKLGEAVRAGLEVRARAEGLRPTGEMVREAFEKRYEEARSSYARTGDPGLGPPGMAPRPSERFTQPEQAAMKALAQAKETMEDLTNGKPLRALTLEVRQPKGPGEAELIILTSSGDRSFDAFVLRSWPTVTVDVGAPPTEVSPAEVVRSVWSIEGWQRSRPNDGTEYLPSFMGLSPARAVSALQGESYQFHARLLRAY